MTAQLFTDAVVFTADRDRLHADAFAVQDAADRARANQSQIHIDFMIGSDEVDVTTIAADGARTPVLRGGDWAF